MVGDEAENLNYMYTCICLSMHVVNIIAPPFPIAVFHTFPRSCDTSPPVYIVSYCDSRPPHCYSCHTGNRNSWLAGVDREGLRTLLVVGRIIASVWGTPTVHSDIYRLVCYWSKCGIQRGDMCCKGGLRGRFYTSFICSWMQWSNYYLRESAFSLYAMWYH